MKQYQQGGATGGATHQQPLTTPCDGPQNMATQNYTQKNSEDTAYFPALRQFIGKVRVGWIVFVFLVGGFWQISVKLLESGWLDRPVASHQLERVIRDQANVNDSLTKSVNAQAIRIQRFSEFQAADHERLIRIETALTILLSQLHPNQQNAGIAGWNARQVKAGRCTASGCLAAKR